MREVILALALMFSTPPPTPGCMVWMRDLCIEGPKTNLELVPDHLDLMWKREYKYRREPDYNCLFPLRAEGLPFNSGPMGYCESQQVARIV